MGTKQSLKNKAEATRTEPATKNGQYSSSCSNFPRIYQYFNSFILSVFRGLGEVKQRTSHCKCAQRYFQQKTPIASNCDSIGQLEITNLKYLPTDYTCISLNIITFHLNVDVTKLKISSDVPSILAKVQIVNRFSLIWYYVIFFDFPLYCRC